MLLSHITSLPLSASGWAIQFHTSALRGRRRGLGNEDLRFREDKKVYELAGGEGGGQEDGGRLAGGKQSGMCDGR